MALTNEEVRHYAISLLTAQTARDRQTVIGASDLSDGCDYHLAQKLAGTFAVSPRADRAWMGRTLGTATHTVLENRIADSIRNQTALFPDAQTELAVTVGHIPGYGDIPGHFDVFIPSSHQLIDWKGSDRAKSLILQDYLRIAEGQEPIYGRTHKNIKLSERAYTEALDAQEYKVTGLYGQQTLYMHALKGAAQSASLVFFNRDGTGWFDNPSEDRYDDPTAVHDVWAMTFSYNPNYAEALIARGASIFANLQSGAPPHSFARHQHCFPCSMEAEYVPVAERPAAA